MKTVTKIILIMGLFSFIKSTGQASNFYELKYFGIINLNNPKDLQAKIEIKGQAVYLDLNFDEDVMSKTQLEKLNSLLTELTQKEKMVFDLLKIDFENNGVSKDYLLHHQEQELIDTVEIEKLKLHSISFYPDNKFNYIWLDYSIGKGKTDYVISIKLNNDLELSSIEMEN